MKKIILSVFVMLSMLCMGTDAFAICMHCPDIQKELNKEIKLTKTQKSTIAKIKKDMRKQVKIYEKQINKEQKKIDKILKQDCPDIAQMMQIKKETAKIRTNIRTAKKEASAQIYETYTPEQQQAVVRIVSENYGIKTKGKCDFCDSELSVQTKCKKCKK